MYDKSLVLDQGTIYTALSFLSNHTAISQGFPFLAFWLLLHPILYNIQRKKMTILIEQPELTSPQAEENIEHSQQITNELVLDGGFPLPKPMSQDGFIAPEINSYGHSFRCPLPCPFTFY